MMSQSDGVDCAAELTPAADLTSAVTSDSNAADMNCASQPDDQPGELTAEHLSPSFINEDNKENPDAAKEGTVHSAEPGDKPPSEQADDSVDRKSECDVLPVSDPAVPSNKARGGRSYQESRRSKKPGIEKTRSGAVGAKYDRASADDHGLSADLSEQKGKGDVQDQKTADGKNVQQNPANILRHEKGQICRPTCDGDPPASVNVIVEEREKRKGAEQLLNLIKHSPSNPDKKPAGKDRGTPSGSRSDLRHKAKPASELEAQWRKEADTKKLQEDEEQRKEEEKQKQLEEAEKLEQERKEREEAEAQRLRDEELKSIQDFINETRDRIDSKSVLRERNLNAAENRPDESFFVKLDSNLKKNTAFVKKLRNLTETQKDALVKDFNSLNLTMYVGEMADAIVEARLKMSDIGCALTLCSLIHQRYADFSSLLLEGWHKVLLTKKDDKVPNASKLRVDLRLFADLVAAGVFTEKEGLSVLATQITLLTANDRDEHNNLSIILSFCKHCGDDYAGLVPRKFRLLAEKYNMEIPRSQLLKGDRQKACRNLLKDYFTSLCKHLLSDCKELRNLEKQNRRILQTKGELSNERKEKYEASQLNFQKLLQNTQMLADLLDEDLPQLPKEEPKSDLDGFGMDMLSVSKGGTEFEPEGDLSLYDDDDTRQFYENIPDLKAIIPGILYKDSEHAASLAADSAAAAEEELDDDDIELLAATEGTDVDIKSKSAADSADTTATSDATANAATASAAAADAVADEKKDAKKDEELLPDYEAVVAAADVDEDEGDVASSMKVMLETYLNNLSHCVNRELIDKAAVEFCMNLNTKVNRRKLVRALFFVHRTRYDLLPFYARLVATLHPCMPSVATDLALMVKTDFKYHVRKKDQINIESKLKSVRFIGELVKFNMFPKSEALHCLKMLLFDFKHHNIEMACGLLETCGRYLYRTAESHQRVKVYLEVMMRKKAALHLDSRYATMIENAYYYSNPPESRPEQRVQRPPMHEYIRKLLYKDLSKTTIERVLRQMRKLDWDNIEVRRYATKCLTEVHNLRYNNIHCCANLLAGLAPYQEAVGIQVTDGVIEDIKLWLEVNHPKYNQQRVSSVHYLGELYNYRMVESQVIFRTLYLFITFGVSLDDAISSVLDPPEHLFRIRLVCVLLETCGQYFDRGSSKKKLDCFLVYFQRYYWFKKKNAVWTAGCPFPRDIEYLFYDTLEMLRPKLHICVSWEEASLAADALDKEFAAKLVELVKVNNAISQQQDSGSLSAIQETDEQDAAGGGLTQLTNENTTQDDSDQEGDQMHSNSQSLSQKDGTYEEDRHVGRRDDDENTGQDYVGSADEEEIVDSAGECDDDEATHVALKHIKCQEDDDFLAAFDKMMSETLQARSQEVTKIPVVDIAVPLSIKTQPKPKPPTLNILSSPSPASPVGQATNLSQGHAASLSQGQAASLSQGHADDEALTDSHGDITFTLLSRKGNKPQFATVNIPSSESFAAKFIEQLELEKMEKERMKRVVLNMHERQEEEDYQEMIAQMNRPLPLNINRDRRVPYQHPKGAPDADVIFGSKKR